MSHGGDCRTAPATPGLLMTTYISGILGHLFVSAMRHNLSSYLAAIFWPELATRNWCCMPILSFAKMQQKVQNLCKTMDQNPYKVGVFDF